MRSKKFTYYKGQSKNKACTYWNNVPMPDKDKNIFVYRKFVDENQVKRFEYCDGKTRIVDDGEIKNSFYKMNQSQLTDAEFLVARCLYCEKTRVCSSIFECQEKFYKANASIQKRTRGMITRFQQGEIEPMLKRVLGWQPQKKFPSLAGWYKEIEPIHENEEYDFIEKCSRGGLQYSDDSYDGIVYKYDINSFYPSIYGSPGFKFPVKDGRLIQLDDYEEAINKIIKEKTYCMVSNIRIDFPEDISPIDRVGLTHTKNMGYFTHYEIQYAHNIGCTFFWLDATKEIEMYYYEEEDLIEAHQLFGDYVRELFHIKQTPNNKEEKDYAKHYMNVVWGLLSKTKTRRVAVKEFQNENNEFHMHHYNDARGFNIFKHCQYDSDGELKTLEIEDKKPIGLLPRIKPFLLTHGRVKMMLKYNADMHFGKCVRIHTDCFWMTEKQPDIIATKERKTLGMLTYEGDMKVNIYEFKRKGRKSIFS